MSTYAGPEALKRRWVKLEDRVNQLSHMMDELKEMNKFQEDVDIRTTGAFMILEKEFNCIWEEQRFIERTGALKV